MKVRKSYPANLLKALRLNETLETDIDYENLTEDQLNGLDYTFDRLTSWESAIMIVHYRDGKTQKVISEEWHVVEKGIQRTINGALKKIRVKEWLLYAANGYEANKKRLEEQSGTEEGKYREARGIADPAHLYYQGIESLNLPARIHNALTKSEILTVRELLLYTCCPCLHRVRNFGKLSMDFVRGVLEQENLLPKNFKMDLARNIPRLDIEASVFLHLNEFEQSAAFQTA